VYDHIARILLGIIAVSLLAITAKLYVPEAQAAVAGMDWTDLKLDYDFKTAVRKIVEDCVVDGDEIDC